VKFTTHMFYRVNGDSTQIRGVRSDIVLPSPFRGMAFKEEDLDGVLPWEEIPAAKYKVKPHGFDLASLTAKSRVRVAADEDFAYIQEGVQQRIASDARDTLSLHIETRRSETERIKAQFEARKEVLEARGWDEETPIDPIRIEALHIVRDALEQTKR
jgi:carboxyl-terminal processing protease